MKKDIIARTNIQNLENLGWNIPEEDLDLGVVEIHIDTRESNIRVIADHPTPGVGPIDLCYSFDSYTETLEHILHLAAEGYLESIEYLE